MSQPNKKDEPEAGETPADGVKAFDTSELEKDTADWVAEAPDLLSEKEMAQAMAGYYFPYSKDKTPLDYLRDPDTGKVPGTQILPNGVSCIDLTNGVDDVNLPALVFWESGQWLSDIDFDDRPLRGVPPNVASNLWVVTGNGLPTNYSFFVYKLPSTGQNAPTTYQTPKHPAMWSKARKKGKGSPVSGYFGGSLAPSVRSTPAYQQNWHESWGIQKQQLPKADPKTEQKQVQKAKTVTKGNPLPAGVRCRCTGCGHWFKMDDLPGHTEVCPQAGGAGYTDWAVMCVSECGCRTLDDVSQPKPGFPRPKKEVKPDETTDTTAADAAAAST